MAQQYTKGQSPFRISDAFFEFAQRAGTSHRYRLNPSARPPQDGREQVSCVGRLRHMETGFAGIPDDFRSDLDQLVLQGALTSGQAR